MIVVLVFVKVWVKYFLLIFKWVNEDLNVFFGKIIDKYCLLISKLIFIEFKVVKVINLVGLFI